MTGPIQVMGIIKTKTNDTIVLIGIGVSRREFMSINDMESFVDAVRQTFALWSVMGWSSWNLVDSFRPKIVSNSIRLRVGVIPLTLSLIKLMMA